MPQLERDFRATRIDGTNKQGNEQDDHPPKRGLVGRLVAEITEKPSILANPAAPVRTFFQRDRAFTCLTFHDSYRKASFPSTSSLWIRAILRRVTISKHTQPL